MQTPTRTPARHTLLAVCALCALLLPFRPVVQGQETPRINYLTFAQGTVPLRVGGSSAALGVGVERALQAIDGNPVGFTLNRQPGPDTLDTEFLYELPARTTFDRFAVPDVLETPSPGQTFTKGIEVFGSPVNADEGFVLLASATLQTHRARGQVTELTIAARPAVRWIKLRLTGGIQPLRPQMFFEFSELIGNGVQDPVARVDHFTGTWQGRGVLVSLKQEGALVSGCYDRTGRLTGSVTGNILRATGLDSSDRSQTAFILSVTPDGVMRGVASTQRAPFRLYTGARGAPGLRIDCPEPPAPSLGCGSVIHGITFDFDSAQVRAESEPVLAKLFDGLRSNTGAAVTVEGHTSSEGTAEYNQTLSERRARAVRDDLVRRGLEASRLNAAGIGEVRPIATNDDESGRSMNRRVEIVCR